MDNVKNKVTKYVTRGIRTFNFSRKTINTVISDLQIVDVIKCFFKKLQIRSLKDLVFLCNL